MKCIFLVKKEKMRLRKTSLKVFGYLGHAQQKRMGALHSNPVHWLLPGDVGKNVL
jgi:hypothetical protein